MKTDEITGHFKFLYLFNQIIGISLIILMVSWTTIYLGGFSDINNPKIEFNWHPLLMTISLIFLYGNSIFIYRSLRQKRNKKMMLFHGIVNACAFILFAFALQAVFDSHNLDQPIKPNLYSLHSWIGLGAVVLYICQSISGFFSFLFPSIDESDFQNNFVPLDIYIGIFGFILAIASALMGLTEKAIFSMKYSTLPNSGRIVNAIGLLMILFGCLIVYLATGQKYKRKPLPENDMLLTNSNDSLN